MIYEIFEIVIDIYQKSFGTCSIAGLKFWDKVSLFIVEQQGNIGSSTFLKKSQPFGEQLHRNDVDIINSGKY